MSFKKVALYGPRDWAIGSINYSLSQNLKEYDVYFLAWDDPNSNHRILSNEFDIVFSEAYIMSVIPDIDQSKTKVIPIFHHNPIDLFGHGHFDNDYSGVIDNFEVFGINKFICKSVEKRYGKKCSLLPIGVDFDFWSTKRKITAINRLGSVTKPKFLHEGWSNSEAYMKTKGYDLFDSIVNGSGLERSHLFGKTFFSGSYIYKDADMVICTSSSEGNPMSLLECAASRIPFISTNVGIVGEFNSVKTFSTPEEAVSIINSFCTEQKIESYVEEVYQDVFKSRSWDKVVAKFYKPLIEK